MSLDNIFVGDYGQLFTIVFSDPDILDEDNNQIDISSYTGSQEIIFEKPDGSQTTEAASFTGNAGTDGKVQFLVTSGFWVAGIWKARGKVTTPGGSTLKTQWVKFQVED